MGGRCGPGSCAGWLRGEVGLERDSGLLDLERARALELGTGGGDNDRTDMMGDGAWI